MIPREWAEDPRLSLSALGFLTRALLVEAGETSDLDEQAVIRPVVEELVALGYLVEDAGGDLELIDPSVVRA
jgi:hypothetical protein